MHATITDKIIATPGNSLAWLFCKPRIKYGKNCFLIGEVWSQAICEVENIKADTFLSSLQIGKTLFETRRPVTKAEFAKLVSNLNL